MRQHRIETRKTLSPSPGSHALAQRLTDEQAEAVKLFRTRESLKITAFAGAGKTSTLVAMAQSSSRLGLYMAFNKSVATEASQKFPKTVDCRTIHSLAFRFAMPIFSSKSKLVEMVNDNAVAAILELQPIGVRGFELSIRSYGSLVRRCVQRFCQSADSRLAACHVPITGKLAILEADERAQISQLVLANAKRLWNRMRDPNDSTPLGHDGYLKLWALSKPRIHRDYILLDEAQDTNDVVLELLSSQDAQLVYVGDTHQQIYEWRGAVNAMARISTSRSSHLTMSFRFGDAIAQAANRILRRLGETRLIRGNPNRSSQIGTFDFDALLSRTHNCPAISRTVSIG